MANMSYCRFRNTLNDFRDCSAFMSDGDDLSPEEHNARASLIEEAIQMLVDLNYSIDSENVDESILERKKDSYY